MWLTEQHNNFWEQGYLVTEKIAEQGDVEVYESEQLGKVLSVDGQLRFSEKDAPAFFEMLSHVPLCSHPEVNKVLIIGGNDGGAVTEVLRHEDVCVDVVDTNEAVCTLAQAHFNQFAPAFESEKVCFHASAPFAFLEKATDASYDVILIQSDIELDELFLAQLGRVLTKKGMLSLASKNWWIEPESVKQTLSVLSEKFGVVMPYRYESYSHAGFGGMMIIASRAYHPTADIILQKSDLLDDLKYYSCDVHMASFALSATMRKELYPAMKI